MPRTVYDLTGLSGFDVVLAPLIQDFHISLETAETLAKQDISTLSRQLVILSDERFGDENDENILQYIERFAQTGLALLYIGVTRDSKAFETRLRELGVQTHLVNELTEEDVQKWLANVLGSYLPQEVDTHGHDEMSQAPSPDDTEPTPENPLCIIVSGAPGAGSTFVGLNLATQMAEHQVVNYVEAGMRPVLTTWLVADQEEHTAILAEPLQPVFSRGNLQVYTRNPFGDEDVNLREIAAHITSWINPTVLDLSLQDYLASSDHRFAAQTVRILVTTHDLHRCRYLEGIPADVVVVNQVPTRLPVDEEEYQAFWPDATLVFFPYEGEQGVAIVQGKAVLHISDTVYAAVGRLWEQVRGGDVLETRIV